jgi:hypothetical protein
VHQAHHDPRTGLILVGFSPPARLAAVARHLGWPGRILTDQERVLYRRLRIRRALLWRIYSPGTLATYATGILHGQRPAPPVEDTRQLGADAIMIDGIVRRLWRPRSPDDRPAAAEVIAAASAWLPASWHCCPEPARQHVADSATASTFRPARPEG